MDIYTCKKNKSKDISQVIPSPILAPFAFHPKSVLKQPSTEVSDATGLLDIKEVHLSFQRHSPVSSIEFRGWSLML